MVEARIPTWTGKSSLILKTNTQKKIPRYIHLIDWLNWVYAVSSIFLAYNSKKKTFILLHIFKYEVKETYNFNN